MNADKGAISSGPAKYRLIDLFTDLSWRVHVFGPDAVITFSENGWRIEDRKAKPTECRLIGIVSDLVDAMKEGRKPDDMVTFFDGSAWNTLA